MEELFFNTDYTTFQQLLIKVLIFLLANGLLLYILYFALSKILFQKSKQRKELILRLVFLWSIFACFILFNIYLFILIYRNGIDAFHWENPSFYLGILPQVLVYTGWIVFFFIKQNAFKKIINNNSIN
jgi:hypothetical protein